MTLARPVVWLTAAETMMPVPADVEWLAVKKDQGVFTEQEVENAKSHGMVSAANPCRITVRLEHSKRFVHYSTWLGWQTCSINGPVAKGILSFLSPSSRANWYVYFGTVKAHRLTSTHALTRAAWTVLQKISDPAVPA